jgi:hypothetical protein
MRTVRRFAVALAGALAVGAVVPAHAGDFTPTTKFDLSSTKVKANPKVNVTVSQDAGEENISSVSFYIPAGFRLPTDAAVDNGEVLGTGQITIALQFLNCDPDAPATFGATISERDRTQNEIAQGIKAVWVVDLSFTQIDLDVYGSTKAGWQLKGEVPQSASEFTCPPFTVHITLNKKSSDSQKPIWRNPADAGKYVLKAVYISSEGSLSRTKQRVKIHS